VIRFTNAESEENGTYMEDLNLVDVGSIKLGVKMTRENGIDLLVCQFARTLDDALANPCIFIGDGASVSIDFEDNTDGESVFARKQ
jgi:hypothetical protein